MEPDDERLPEERISPDKRDAIKNRIEEGFSGILCDAFAYGFTYTTNSGRRITLDDADFAKEIEAVPEDETQRLLNAAAGYNRSNMDRRWKERELIMLRREAKGLGIPIYGEDGTAVPVDVLKRDIAQHARSGIENALAEAAAAYEAFAAKIPTAADFLAQLTRKSAKENAGLLGRFFGDKCGMLQEEQHPLLRFSDIKQPMTGVQADENFARDFLIAVSERFPGAGTVIDNLRTAQIEAKKALDEETRIRSEMTERRLGVVQATPAQNIAHSRAKRERENKRDILEKAKGNLRICIQRTCPSSAIDTVCGYVAVALGNMPQEKEPLFPVTNAPASPPPSGGHGRSEKSNAALAADEIKRILFEGKKGEKITIRADGIRAGR